MFANDTIKVHVVYGDGLVAAGLTATLRDQSDFEFVAQTLAFDPATSANRHPDVIVADYEHGLAVLAWARTDPRLRHLQLPPVLIVTQRDTESEIRHALEQGARGYLLLGCSIEELVNGVRSLRAGTRYIGGKAAQRLADSVACEALTGREQAVLRLVVEGLGNKAIANRLDIAIGTVKSHLKAIFQKLNAASRTEVATLAERRGLLTLADARTCVHDETSGRAGDVIRATLGEARRRVDLGVVELHAQATH